MGLSLVKDEPVSCQLLSKTNLGVTYM